MKLATLLLLAPSLAHATCSELALKGETIPGLTHPHLYLCTTTLTGAPTPEEGFQRSLEQARAEAGNFAPLARCREIGVDQQSKFHSFCDPMSMCTGFVTYLTFSCGFGPAK